MLRALSSIYCHHLKSTRHLACHTCKRYPTQVLTQISNSFHDTTKNRQIKTVSTTTQLKDVNFKVIGDELPPTVNDSTILDSNVELDDLELCISGQKLTFNLTWLRDSCHCTHCTHQYSRQRLFTIKDFRKEKFSINDIQLLPSVQQDGLLGTYSLQTSDDSELNIKWQDGHVSRYSVNWLRYVDSLYRTSQLQPESCQKIKFRYPEDDLYASTSSSNFKQEFWNVAEINSKLKLIDFHDLVDGFNFNDDDATFINGNRIVEMSSRRFNAMSSLTHQLVTYGLAKIVNVPQERNQVLKTVRSLAYERPTGYGTVFDVVVEPSEDINLAYSSLEFDLHSDLTYRETSPGVQLLHCIRDSTEGGLSYFSDAFNAVQTLRQTHPNLVEVLLQFPATFVVKDPYRDVKFRRQHPIVSLDYQREISDVYYSPFMLPPIGFKDDLKLFYLALDKLTQSLQSKENKLIVKMNPGDLFIFHNRRVLHGRSAYDATTSSRFLQGCYMDWDEIRCLHEKLHTNKSQR